MPEMPLEERLAHARVSRERCYQKWLRGDQYRSAVDGWDEYIAKLERELASPA